MGALAMQLTIQDAFALAARHEAAGRHSDARRIYDEILSAVPEHPGALLKIALQQLATGAHQSARSALTRALESAKRQNVPAHDIWLALARADLALGDGAAAANAIAEAHEAAKRLKTAGATAVAYSLLRELVALAPDDPGLPMTLGAVLLDAHRSEEATRELERAISLGAAGGEVSDNLGLAYRMQGHDEQALAAFERAVGESPSLTPALANLINTRYALCEWDGLAVYEERLLATLEDR